MPHDPLGSVWRRWDLHFHTPASYDYQRKSVTAEQLVEGLLAAGIAVVAVTDHHVIDVGLIRRMQQLGGDNLTVLPGIELRSELGGSDYVHYIGIFPENCDLEEVWLKLRGQLPISEADVQQRGHDSVYVPIQDGCECIRALGGLVTIHAGRKSNSIEELTNADAVKRAVKADLACKHLHALEVGRTEDLAGYRTIIFPHIGKTLPLLICSDNHDITRYGTKG